MHNKLIFKLLITTILLLSLFFSFMPLHGYAMIINPENDVYDIILFLGQSNMVGSARDVPETRYSRSIFNLSNIWTPGQYASITKINSSILRKTGQTLNFVSIKQKPNTVFEYMALTNSFREIDSTQKQNYGEALVYKNGLLLGYNQTDKSYLSLSISSGTNMIPQFCKTYYENTGHKVIAVCAGIRGVAIEGFLPHNDSRNIRYKNNYIYEAIKTKYLSAVNLARSKNLNIGHKFYVIAQGENDVTAKTTTKQYKKMYKTLHYYLTKQLGIEMGALVETSTTPGTNTMKQVNQVHKAQEEIIKENPDIILGSAYFYNRYIPAKSDYNNCNTQATKAWNGKKLVYEEALKRAIYSRDPSINAQGKHNLNHYTSAALCQVGLEAATNLSIYGRQ